MHIFNKRNEKERNGQTRNKEGQTKRKGVGGVWALTLTGPIRPSKYGALLNLAEGLKQPPDVVLALLLAEHPHKQLPVFWIRREMRRGRRGRRRRRRRGRGSEEGKK